MTALQSGVPFRISFLNVWAILRLLLLQSDLSKFSSAEDLREFLTRLLIQATKGRVSPRRAAVLAYITNQLLHSHCVGEKELDKESENVPQIIFDLPRPQRD